MTNMNENTNTRDWKLITLKRPVAVVYSIIPERSTTQMAKALAVTEMIAFNESKEYRCVVVDIGTHDKDGLHMGWMGGVAPAIVIEIKDDNIESIQRVAGKSQ
jgi:hypothetical protein